MKKIIILILIHQIGFLSASDATPEQQQLQTLANQVEAAQETTNTPTIQVAQIKKNIRKEYQAALKKWQEDSSKLDAELNAINSALSALGKMKSGEWNRNIDELTKNLKEVDKINYVTQRNNEESALKKLNLDYLEEGAIRAATDYPEQIEEALAKMQAQQLEYNNQKITLQSKKPQKPISSKRKLDLKQRQQDAILALQTTGN